MKKASIALVLAVVIAVAVWLVLLVKKIGLAPESEATQLSSAPSNNNSINVAVPERAPATRAESWTRIEELTSRYSPPTFEVTVFDDYLPLRNSWAETNESYLMKALEGDERAQFALYLSSYRCYRAPKSEDELEGQIELASAPYYDARGDYIHHPKSAKDIQQSLHSAYTYCRDADKTSLEEYVTWLEMSADSGYLPAMLRFGSDYPGDEYLDGAIEAHVDEMNSRRSEYMKYLFRAAEQGSLDAMATLAGMHAESSTTEDRISTFKYLYAYAWYRLKYKGEENSFKYLNDIGMSIGPADYAKALNSAREILASPKCCIILPNHDS